MSLRARAPWQRTLDSALWAAAAAGDSERIKALLRDGANIDSESQDESDSPQAFFYDLYGFTFYKEAAMVRPLPAVPPPAVAPQVWNSPQPSSSFYPFRNGSAAGAGFFFTCNAWRRCATPTRAPT